jgi:hypothetical protein
MFIDYDHEREGEMERLVQLNVPGSSPPLSASLQVKQLS